MANGELAENYFNILSNFVCLLPTALFLQDRNYYDAIIVFGTGITSFLYHLNNNDPPALNYFVFDQTGIQVADAILSDILVFQISSYLAFYKNYMLRSSLLFLFLPFEIYMAVTSRGKFHLYILFMLVGVFSIFMLNHLHKNNKIRSKYMVIFICGAIMNIVEIVMYADLQERYDDDYNIYHGIHHITAFFSILFYFFVPKNFIFQRPFLRNIRSYEDFQTIDNNVQTEDEYKSVEKGIKRGSVQGSLQVSLQGSLQGSLPESAESSPRSVPSTPITLSISQSPVRTPLGSPNTMNARRQYMRVYAVNGSNKSNKVSQEQPSSRLFSMQEMKETHEYNSGSDLYRPEYHEELTKRIHYLRSIRANHNSSRGYESVDGDEHVDTGDTIERDKRTEPIEPIEQKIDKINTLIHTPISPSDESVLHNRYEIYDVESERKTYVNL